MDFLNSIEGGFRLIVQYGILFLEFAGVFVLLVTAVKSLIGYLRRDARIRLGLAQGIALALEFKLGGEVLRTVVARQQTELITLGAVILLRGALTFLIHWEIKEEEARMDIEQTDRHGAQKQRAEKAAAERQGVPRQNAGRQGSQRQGGSQPGPQQQAPAKQDARDQGRKKQNAPKQGPQKPANP